MVITAAIDEFHQDDVAADGFVEAMALKVFHFNPKMVCKAWKRECFKRQLHGDNTSWAASPEARPRVTEVKMLRNFVVAATAADKGFGGCEIWLNTKVVIGMDGDTKLHLHEQT